MATVVKVRDSPVTYFRFQGVILGPEDVTTVGSAVTYASSSSGLKGFEVTNAKLPIRIFEARFWIVGSSDACLSAADALANVIERAQGNTHESWSLATVEFVWADYKLEPARLNSFHTMLHPPSNGQPVEPVLCRRLIGPALRV